ncbi:hypothetical protein FSP39_009509 [Pinctada imbricata]|uniref:VWFA domain-containing protein n=1 Tax=Pinctada imbricata TaxID=66713 RepID=A0AA89BJ93_PINIB|nr:hypothetical protein FSP39_009509 [Pinctada imbricata]
MLQFVQGFAKEFNIGPLNVQIGVVTYSTSVHEYIRLNSNRDQQSLLYNINRLPYQSGLTRTADAINLTLYHGFSQPHGDRDSVTDVMMVITDGQSQDPRATAAAARRAHNAGVKTFAIGVGNRVKATEMDTIASDKNYVFHVSNYDALQQLKEELRNKTCEGNGIPTPTLPVVTLQRRTSTTNLPTIKTTTTTTVFKGLNTTFKEHLILTGQKAIHCKYAVIIIGLKVSAKNPRNR